MLIQESITLIGCIWHLNQGLVVPSPDKLELATARALALLDAQTSTSRDWMRLTGKLLWFANLHRPLLACKQAIFSRANGPSRENNKTKCPSSSKRELRTLTALLPFARVEINLPIAHIIVAFDASLTAGAVTYAYATDQLAEKLWVAAQSARFQRGRDPSEQLPGVTEIVQACHWKVAFTDSWRKPDYINCLEASTAVLVAEWLTRRRIAHTRVKLLTDSLVNLGALQKGLSSRTDLLLRRRKFAAIVLAHMVRATLALVRLGINPADPYTRMSRRETVPEALTQNLRHRRMGLGRNP